MDDVSTPFPDSLSTPGEDLMRLMPDRPSLNRGFGLLQQGSRADRAAQDLRPSTPAQWYAAELQRATMWSIPLPGGFSVPLPLTDIEPVPLRVGGQRPTVAEQLESMYFGQRTDTGFNLFGANIRLPQWLGGTVLTHQSAELVFQYRNLPPGLSRDLVRMRLELIHPGHARAIDSETLQGRAPTNLLPESITPPMMVGVGIDGVFHATMFRHHCVRSFLDDEC